MSKLPTAGGDSGVKRVQLSVGKPSSSQKPANAGFKHGGRVNVMPSTMPHEGMPCKRGGSIKYPYSK